MITLLISYYTIDLDQMIFILMHQNTGSLRLAVAAVSAWNGEVGPVYCSNSIFSYCLNWTAMNGLVISFSNKVKVIE